MWVITGIIHMFYASNWSIASIVSNASNYLQYLHGFMQVMWVITCIICSICDIRMIWIFKYFESNNNLMRIMQVRFESSINAMRVMWVFESRWGGSCLARPCYASICEYMQVYASIQISLIFFWYSSMLNPKQWLWQSKANKIIIYFRF